MPGGFKYSGTKARAKSKTSNPFNPVFASIREQHSSPSETDSVILDISEVSGTHQSPQRDYDANSQWVNIDGEHHQTEASSSSTSPQPNRRIGPPTRGRRSDIEEINVGGTLEYEQSSAPRSPAGVGVSGSSSGVGNSFPTTPSQRSSFGSQQQKQSSSSGVDDTDHRPRSSLESLEVDSELVSTSMPVVLYGEEQMSP